MMVKIKKPKGSKKCLMKRMLKFYCYLDCLLKNEIILKSPKKFKSEAHNVYTDQ